MTNGRSSNGRTAVQTASTASSISVKGGRPRVLSRPGSRTATSSIWEGTAAAHGVKNAAPPPGWWNLNGRSSASGRIDRKRVVSGKRVLREADHGGSRIVKKQKKYTD